MKRKANPQKALDLEKPKLAKSVSQVSAVKNASQNSKTQPAKNKIKKSAESKTKKSAAIKTSVEPTPKKAAASVKFTANQKKSAAAEISPKVKKRPAVIEQKNKIQNKKAIEKAAFIESGKKTPSLKQSKVVTKKTVVEAKIKVKLPKAGEKSTLGPKSKKKVSVPGQKPETRDRSKIVSAEKAKTQVKRVKSSLQTKAVKAPVAEIKPKAAVDNKPLKKKIKPISSAVLRGKSGRYDFEVFPLDAEFEKIPAIYVISKRVTDKQKRGHHKFICIGHTDSIIDDIKKHKKDKFIRQNKANVVCLLKEQDEKNRLKIATDLREAHTIVCNHK